MTLLQIKYFMEAVRCGSFTDTARALYVAQPSVTKQISDFEKELGFSLFHRLARGVELSEQGNILYQALRRCEDTFSTALHQARILSSPGIKLMIGQQSMIETSAISTAIHSFLNRNQHTNVTFRRIPLLEIIPALQKHELDIAILIDTGIPERSHIDHFPLLPSGDYLLTNKSSDLPDSGITHDMLQDLRLVQERSRNGLYSSVFGPQTAICQQLGFREENTIVCDVFESCLSTVEHGDGVMIVDEYTVFPNKENFRIINLNMHHYISVAWCRDGSQPIALELAEWLRDTFQGVGSV